MSHPKKRSHRPRNRNYRQANFKNRFQKRKPRDHDRYTTIDHAPISALLTTYLPQFCKLLGLPEKSILRFFGDEANRYTDKHRVSYEAHSDTIDELQEFEEDFKTEKKKLRGQEPQVLIDENRIQPLYLVGLLTSLVLLVLSFAATVIATSVQVREHTPSGSLYYALSIGLIAAFGSSILKWSVQYPFAEFKTQVEMLLVPVAFIFFGLFVYQLTELYFYMEPIVATQNVAPDFSQFLTDTAAGIESTQTQDETMGVISLKWFYIGVLGTEMFASYSFLSFISTCATPQFKAIVRAIKALEGRARAPRHRNRCTIRHSRKLSSGLQYQAEKSKAPGRALLELSKRLFK